MNIFKNKTVIGILSILAAFVVSFVLIPSLYKNQSKTITVIKANQMIKKNTLIEPGMLTEVRVGSYNLPQNVITKKNDIVNKYALTDIYDGDILMPEKFTTQKEMDDEFLYRIIKDNKTAVSVSVKSLASGLSGKLLPGDIVTVLVYVKGESVSDPGHVKEYPELKYVEVGAVTNGKAEDTDKVKSKDKDEASATDTIIPAAVTLLVDEEQAQKLVEAENTGLIHIVFRGRGEQAKLLAEKNDSKGSLTVNENEMAAEGEQSQNQSTNSQADNSQEQSQKDSDSNTFDIQ